MHRTGIAILSALALAACASTTDGSQSASNDCFNSSQARGFNVIDRNHIGLSVGANRTYILTTAWNANDLDWTHAIALRSSTGRICTGNGLGVDLIGGDPQRTFQITNIERAPDDQAVEGS